MNILCTVCEDVTPTKNLETFTLKNNKRAIKGLCTSCDSNKILLLGKEGGKLFVGELHLPNHNYTGLFTRTDLRLNEDLTPKDWSIPINKVYGIDDIWASDLVVMPPERSYRYILTVLDVFSKYAWAIPLQTKTGVEITEAFKKIFKESRRQFKKLWVDRGTEYYNKIFLKFLKDNNCEIYSTQSELKCMVAERFNRTLKEMMYKKFTELETNKWVKSLPELVNEYNNRVHRTIGMTPVDGSKKENEEQIKREVFSTNFTNSKPRFHVGEYVRIYKYKNLFEKGYLGRWTKEVFKVAEVLQTEPVTYLIQDSNGEIIKGGFYQEELLKSSFTF